MALQIRYFAVNLAAVSGPLIGITFGLNSQKSTFLITAFSYLPFLAFVLFAIPDTKGGSANREQGESIWRVARLIGRDRIYLIALLCSILCYLVYAQIESTLPQYLLALDSTRAVGLVTTILVTNAVTVLLAQLWLVKLMGTISMIQRIVIGAVIFAFSQLLFWVNDSTSALWWGFVAVIFSIAEAILLPNLSVLLDRLAPEKHRGAYLGASTLVILGLSLGPCVGGALLEWYGKAVFCVMAFGCLTIAALLLINRSATNVRLE